jgi:hypothetical protein
MLRQNRLDSTGPSDCAFPLPDDVDGGERDVPGDAGVPDMAGVPGIAAMPVDEGNVEEPDPLLPVTDGTLTVEKGDTKP